MFCRYCGNEISDDAIFCKKCGKKLSVTGQNEETNSFSSSSVPKAVSGKRQKTFPNQHSFTKPLAIIVIVFLCIMLPFRISGMLMKDHYTLLMAAAKKNNQFLVRTLLFLGADAAAKDHDGVTALNYSAGLVIAILRKY